MTKAADEWVEEDYAANGHKDYDGQLAKRAFLAGVKYQKEGDIDD